MATQKTTPKKRAPAAKGKVAPSKGVDKKKAAAGRRPAHRPSAYKPEYVDLAYKFCLLGATDKRMAEFFGVSEVTFNAWKSVHPDFLKSLKDGKEIADAQVADALFNRAKGYSHAEDDIKSVALGGNAGSEIVITPTIKHYPPDTNAASLWLRNRQPKLWRDKTEVSHANDPQNPLLPSAVHSLTTEQLMAIASGKGV